MTSGFYSAAELIIDNALLRDAMRATGLKTEREVVELGLRTLLRLHKQAEIRQLRGQIAWHMAKDADLPPPHR